MPDLKNCFFYKDWILDLAPIKTLRWDHSHVYHQCKLGIINSCWVQSLYALEPGRAVSIVDDNPEAEYRNVCKGCGAVTSDNEDRVLRATGKLIHKP